MLHKNDLKKRIKKTGLTLITVILIYSVMSFCAAVIICAAVFNSDYDTVTKPSLKSIDNCVYKEIIIDDDISGHLLTCPEQSDRLILIIGGLNSSPDSYCEIVRCFADRGFNVMVLDYKKNNTLFGFPEIAECTERAVEYLNACEETKDYSVAILGFSAGGYGALSSLDSLPDGCKVISAVSVSAFDSPLDMMTYHAKQKVGGLSGLCYPFLFLYQKIIFGDTTDKSASSSVGSSDLPVLIIEGDCDRTVPPSLAVSSHKELIKNGKTEWLTINGNKKNAHAERLLESETGLNSEYMEIIISFISDSFR